MATRADERAAELQVLREHAAELEANVHYLESERGIEEAIRDRYDAVRDGERAVIVLDEPRSAASAAPAALPAKESESFLSRLFSWW